MSMAIQHNLTAMFANRQLKITKGTIHKSAEKLASGYRINRSADDAAGLAISEKMRKQIRGLTQASANLQDGVSLAQVADGALAEVHDMIHRINELAVKAANGTVSDNDRKNINSEVQALKREVSRVFKTTKFNELEIFRTVEMIYNPDIEDYPTDMGIFHSGNGGIGGLEFNNVRYTIAELQNKGLLIDENGKATADFETEFRLWDGEEVKLSMKAGDSLNNAVRNYNWKAEEKGIYINGVLAAEWKEMTVDGVLGAASGKGTFPSGEYSFTHHGMKITFEADQELYFADLQERINGNDEIQPATWDVRVGSTKTTKAADIDNSKGYSIRVTEANKSYMDHTFVLVADENGLAVKDSTAGSQTAYVAWSTFKDSSKVSITDENGNTVHTNGGYPIVDWGSSDYSNDESGITFDAGATYHFTSPNSDLKIQFDFSLAEYASLDEVKAALNGVTLSTGSLSPSGRIDGSESDNGIVNVTSSPFASSFSLQRAYGRNFNQSNATLTGDLNVKRTTIDGQPSASDRPNSTGGYAGGAHSVTNRVRTGRTMDSLTSSSPEAPVYVTIQSETYTDYVYDDGGNKVQKTDENGDPVFDEHGDPVYETEEKVRWHFFEQYDIDCTEIYTNTYNATDTWTQDVTYTFDGTFAGHDMTDVERTEQETYRRNLTQTRKETYTYVKKEIKEVDYSELNSNVKSILEANPELLENPGSSFSGSYDAPGGISIGIGRTGNYDPSILNQNGAITPGSRTYAGYVTPESGVGAAEFIRIGTSNFTGIDFVDSDSHTLFTFDYEINLEQAKGLANTSGSADLGDVTFTAGGYVYRNFRPNEKTKSISEAQFSNVNVNEVKLEIPSRHLIIQSGADSDDQIEMVWNPLNLSSLSLYKTKIRTQEEALAAIDQASKALQVISDTRELFGAYQNRFEHAIRMTDNTVENTTYAESMIRDTDMAKEMVRFSNQNIIAEAGQAMLANANQSKNGVLTLLS